MIKDVKFVHLGMTYEELKLVLKADRHIKVFPLVDNPMNMILLGSVSRKELIDAIEHQIGLARRLQIVALPKKEPEQDTQSLMSQPSVDQSEQEEVFNYQLIKNKSLFLKIL